MHLNIAFERYRLDNGLTVLLHRDTTTPIAAVNLWYNVGSWNERPGKTGLAHLFEHMMFQGTPQVPDDLYFRLIQSRGGTLNGSTSFNRTNFYETVPSHHLEMALWMEADRMAHLTEALTPEKLENQRDVVKNERRQQIDNQPYGLWLEKTLALAYPPQAPYHWPIIGYMEDLERATLSDVRAFFNTYYKPNNASLVIAGDFDTQQVNEWVDRYFGGIAPGEIPPPSQWPSEIYHRGERREIVPDRVQLPRLFISYHIPGMEDEHFAAAEIVSAVLSSGKSSRLYNNLVLRRQLAREAYCFILPLLHSSLMVFTVTPMPETDIQTLEQVLWDEIERLRLSDIQETELERIKNQLVAYKVRELQTVESVANNLNHHHSLFGDPELINTELEKYYAVSKEQAADFARQWLVTDNRVALTFVPQQKEPTE